MVEAQGLPNMRLGKEPHKHDDRTVMMADFLITPPTGIPTSYNFERNRAPFPAHMWGNDNWGDCVRAARANHQQRLQRIETRQTIPITDQMVIDGYKTTTGAVNPGDSNDSGLVMLDDYNLWRSGWHLPVWDAKGRTYNLDAFGLLRPDDREELRAGAYLLTGVQFGINLPWSAAKQIQTRQAWDVPAGGTSGDGEPGTWGGHCVYSCQYDSKGWYVWTWGAKQYMTDAFVEAYADEVWAVVQANETHSRYVDVAKLDGYLVSIGAKRY